MELPFQNKARNDEEFKLKLPAHSLPEFATEAQGHRLDDEKGMEDIKGVLLPKVGHDGLVAYKIFRDPLTGEVYKSKKG